MIEEIFRNRVLLAAVLGWTIAQVMKVPLDYAHTRKINWSLLFSPGGMPSSHTALVSGTAHALGLYYGFDTSAFAVAFTLAVVVIYDATGVRLQAGKHAALINKMIADLASGHPLKEEQLREVLGHTPREAFMGMVLGVGIAYLMYLLWPLP